ncbi:hypothetical protein C8R47DRAFT_812096 [Mycena vitilis]|nr:hypothetical protein C8R47DRAFT_812096 [Mycena vitilis]
MPPIRTTRPRGHPLNPSCGASQRRPSASCPIAALISLHQLCLPHDARSHSAGGGACTRVPRPIAVPPQCARLCLAQISIAIASAPSLTPHTHNNVSLPAIPPPIAGVVFRTMPLRCLLADRPIALASVASSRCPHSHSPPRFPARLGRRSVPPNHTGNGCEEEGKPRVARVVTEVPPQVRRIWGREREREGAASVVGRGGESRRGTSGAPAAQSQSRTVGEGEGEGEEKRRVRRHTRRCLRREQRRVALEDGVSCEHQHQRALEGRHRSGRVEMGRWGEVCGARRLTRASVPASGAASCSAHERAFPLIAAIAGSRAAALPQSSANGRTHVTRAFVYMTVQRAPPLGAPLAQSPRDN